MQKYEPAGETKLVATNDTDEGRQLKAEITDARIDRQRFSQENK